MAIAAAVAGTAIAGANIAGAQGAPAKSAACDNLSDPPIGSTSEKLPSQREAFSTSLDGHDFCIVRYGTPPNVNVWLYADGTAVSGLRYEACTYHRAGRDIQTATIENDAGDVVTWLTLPARATGGSIETYDGKLIEFTAVGDNPERYALLSGDITTMNRDTFKTRGAEVDPAGPSTVSCDRGQA
jgi:hypothetical protein